MRPREFDQMNCVFAKNQGEYMGLPANKSKEGVVVSSWSLSFTERIRVLFRGRIFVTMLSFNHPVQPLRLATNNPFECKEEQ